MKRTPSFLFFVLFFLSCNKNPAGTCPTPQAEIETATTSCELPDETTPVEDVSPVSAEALNWNADIYFVNFDDAQEDKVQKAVALIKKVIASKEFRHKVLNYTYNGKKSFFDNGGFTNAEVYQKILNGAEKMGDTTKNNTMNVELELYYAATNTIGYTYPNSTRIWMNTKYFNTYTPVKVADNLTHEWMHKIGFGHATSYSESRNHSVPYAVGYIVEELAKTLP